MDLQADKQVAFKLGATDEVGNETTLTGTVTFEVDDPSILTLTDNGDGSGTVAATGTLGVATLTGRVANPDGTEATGVAAIQVVAGDAQTFQFSFEAPTEVTPDGEAPEEPTV